MLSAIRFYLKDAGSKQIYKRHSKEQPLLDLKGI
jgi:hypothetical protein